MTSKPQIITKPPVAHRGKELRCNADPYRPVSSATGGFVGIGGML